MSYLWKVLIEKILYWIRRVFHARMSNAQYENLQKIYVGKSEEYIFIRYFSKVLNGIFLILFVGCFCIVLCSITTHQRAKLRQGVYLEKGDVLEGEQTVSLQVDNGVEEKKINIDVPNRKYSEQEEKEAFQQVKKKMFQKYLGENQSAECVEKPLRLITKIDGYAINIQWELDSSDIVQKDGTLRNNELEEATQVEIAAVLSYDQSKERIVFPLTILPKKKTLSEELWSHWEKQLYTNIEEKPWERYLHLPEKVDGYDIKYLEKQTSSYSVIGIFMILFMAALPIFFKSRTKEQIQKREKQLKLDYPEFVEHFVLLIGAGLTLKGAWERIVSDYRKKAKRKEVHYVYEEMEVTLRNMQNGMSEARAYELFGKRIGILQYMKFCTLMEQNMKKGTTDILRLLDYEMADAFAERRENAKMLGEKAGTKLLLPMAFMLLIVFVMILYAAFYSM